MRKKAAVSRLCALLGISRSGFYAAQAKRARPPRLSVQEVHLQAVFAASGRTYGSRRLCKAMQARGFVMGRCHTRTLMKRLKLQARFRRKFAHTSNSRHGLPVAGNVLNRQFHPNEPDKAWVSDITYVRTASGWLYLAAVLDLYSRKVVGWAMAPSMPAELACSALQMAITLRQPPAGLLVHSDRGSQYASAAHTQLLDRHGCIASMSRKGNCWDNAVMERFFLSLKLERVWQHRYANPAEAKADIADYIVNFYNTQRLHSTLGYMSPVDFEKTTA
jgi:transposase InsO family protein